MKYLAYRELKEKKGIPFSRPWLWRLEKKDRFPKRVSIGGKTVAWVEDQIDEWMKKRLDAPPCQGVAGERSLYRATVDAVE